MAVTDDAASSLPQSPGGNRKRRFRAARFAAVLEEETVYRQREAQLENARQLL